MPYGFPDDEWSAAKDAARSVLQARAAAGETITYAELTATPVGPIAFQPDDAALGKLLGELSTASVAKGAGMLSAVVVRRSGGLPGAGFFALAERLGRAPVSVEDRRAFWEAELAGVFRAYRQP